MGGAGGGGAFFRSAILPVGGRALGDPERARCSGGEAAAAPHAPQKAAAMWRATLPGGETTALARGSEPLGNEEAAATRLGDFCAGLRCGRASEVGS